MSPREETRALVPDLKAEKNDRWMLDCENLSSWLWPEKGSDTMTRIFYQSIVSKINSARADLDNWSS